MVRSPSTPPRRIETANFVLRPWETGDADTLSAAVIESQTELAEWLPWAKGDLSPEHYRSVIDAFAAAWDDGRDYVYGVVGHDGTALGGSGYHLRRGPDTLEIGYWIRTSRVGEGLATAVTAKLTDVAFTIPGVEHVAVAVDVENERSAMVPTRLGFSIRETVPAARDTTRASGWHNVFMVSRAQWGDRARVEGRDLPKTGETPGREHGYPRR